MWPVLGSVPLSELIWPQGCPDRLIGKTVGTDHLTICPTSIENLAALLPYLKTNQNKAAKYGDLESQAVRTPRTEVGQCYRLADLDQNLVAARCEK
ncbi:hypothetical protein [Ruegeria sp. SCP11]|uniref:hypothetical protein n=1 Tax=Ruegeria sp. SCP11 TaxID=3141378 RepID=UPI00333D0225